MSAIQGIEGVISQLQATAMSAKMQDMQPQPTVSFAGQLHAALDRISDVQTASRTQVEKFTLGEPGIALNDVMTDMQKRRSRCRWVFRYVTNWCRPTRK